MPVTSEIQELFQSVSDNISHLFRLSVVIRNATSRDRFAKAAAKVAEPFDDQYDIAHVGQKFPRLELEGREWLKVRLGKAITWRRQYLRYCREHQEKLSVASPQPGAFIKKTEPHEQTPSEDRDQKSAIEMSNLLAPTIAPSLLAPTTASTFVADDDEIVPTIDDQRSQVSYATSLNENNTPDILQIMPLDKASEGRPEFVCPYCWTIQSQARENSWR